MFEIALELQQLDLAANHAPAYNTQADQYAALKLHIDALLNTLIPPNSLHHRSTTALFNLPDTQASIEFIKEQLTRWSHELASTESRIRVPEEITASTVELEKRARQIVIDIHLAMSLKRDDERKALYNRHMQLRWMLISLLFGGTFVVAKLTLDRHLNERLSRNLSLLNKKLEMRVSRRTQQLVEGRALLLFILDACPNATALVQADSGKVHFINREFLEQLNKGPHIDSLQIQDLLMDTDERSRFMNELELYGRVDNWETKINAPIPYWSSLSVKLVEVEGQLSYLLWAFNISKHKELLTLLEIQASTDVLTALYNRRAFYERSKKILESCRRYGHLCSVLMLDIDNFKQINDLYGHAIGDDAIRMVGQVLKSDLREIDVIGRVGGEEFAVILPHTLSNEAWETAERLRCAIENSFIECATGKLRLTVSIGVTSLTPQGNQTIENLISIADKALYRAKKSGRNRVEAEKHEHT
ncbi:hypothetical protein BK671_14365 [Pseudomonas fluorescens]|uniref:diguanylate cyclase n=2 Tax=Pseudomonas fluorescens TaxID=294 RepID=A0A423LFS0_PSEFL|nr:hypothetical protein BK671_14365 [Pseudomonas fluorescens]